MINPVLDTEGLAHYHQLLKSKELGAKANKSAGVFYIEGSGDTAGVWLGTHSDIIEYFPGLMIAYKPSIAGATGLTLNINNLGAVTVVRNTTSAVTTHYGVGSILMLIYTVDSDGTAYWKIADYDSDTKARSSNKTGSKMYIIGATSQSTTGQTTYSNSNCYIGTDNCLYSGGKKVSTEDTNTTYSLSKSGSTITLTGSDGSTTSVADSNTTYTNADLGQGYGTCATAAATTAKDATLSGYKLVTGGLVAIHFTNAVPPSATLNINSTGAKSIYYKGAAIVDGIICAGEVGLFAYDGSKYNLLSVDRNRFYSSLVPYGTQITATEGAPVDLNSVEYMKVGNYYCSANAQAKYVANIPEAGTAFMMQVYSPLSPMVDNENGTWVYRIRKLTHYQGTEYVQYSYTNGTGGNWSYGAWYKTISSKNVASASALGVVKIGENISVSSGTISLTKDNVTTALGYTPPTTNTTYSAVTQSSSGLMTADDKKKLDGIDAGANAYTLPTAGSTLGGVKTTSTVTSTSGLTACPIISGVPYYKDTNTTYTLSSFDITATATELNYCDGVTSNIQTQLNGKLSTSGTAAKATADASGNNIANTYMKKSSITSGTSDLTAGTSTLATGSIYLVYE